MAVETDDDRSYLLADWGVDASYMRDKRYGTEATIKGIFDNDVQEIDAGGSTTFHVEVPRFFCRTSDTQYVAEGDILTISGVKYIILVASPDGQGFTELRLEKQ